MIKIEFVYDKEEYIKGIRKYLFASKIITKPSIVFMISFIIVGIIGMIFHGFDMASILFFGFAAVLATMYCILYLYMPRKGFLKTKEIHDVYQFEFTEDIIHVKTKTVTSDIKWDAYTEVWESNEFFYFIQTRNVYMMIPKRVFQDETEIKALQEILNQKIEKVKRIK